MTHRLDRRVTKLEKGTSDDHLTHLSDDELREYEIYLDARLEGRNIELPAKFIDVDRAAGVCFQNEIKDMSDEELAAYEAEIDSRLAELEEVNG